MCELLLLSKRLTHSLGGAQIFSSITFYWILWNAWKIILKEKCLFFSGVFLNLLCITVQNEVSEKRGVKCCWFNSYVCCPADSLFHPSQHEVFLEWFSSKFWCHTVRIPFFLCCASNCFFKKYYCMHKNMVKIGIVFWSAGSAHWVFEP